MSNRDKMHQAATTKSDGRGWLKLPEGEAVDLEILDYMGQVESKFKKDSGDPKYNHRFLVLHEGKEKKIDGGFRLLVAIDQVMEEGQDFPFRCTMTRTQGIEEIGNKDGSKRKTVVNKFSVVPF